MGYFMFCHATHWLVPTLLGGGTVQMLAKFKFSLELPIKFSVLGLVKVI